jgi:protein TonB
MAIGMHRVGRQVSTMFGSPKRSTLLSVLIHAAAIVLIVAATHVAQSPLPQQRPTSYVRIDLRNYLPPVDGTGGGGGGAGDLTRASKGRLPRPAPHQYTPPMVVVRNVNPILSMEPTIIARSDIAMPAIPLPDYGLPDGASGPLSGGRGKNGGIGDGEGGGVGDRKGPGAGEADGGGISGPGGSIRRNLTPPVLLVKVEPEYSDEGRRAKISGTVLLTIDVDTRGEVHNIVVKRSLGLGLDEKAIEAVSRWKFRPGTIDGKAAVISALVEVNFRLM